MCGDNCKIFMSNEYELKKMNFELTQNTSEIDELIQKYKKLLDENFISVVNKIEKMLIARNLKFEILKNEKEDELRFNNNLKIYFNYKNDLIRLSYKSDSGKNSITTFTLTYIKYTEYSYTSPDISKKNYSKELEDEKKIEELKRDINLTKEQINSIKNSIALISATEQKLFYSNNKSCSLELFVDYISTKI